MPLVHRCGYWFADLFNDFTGNFLVFYLRWNVSDFRSLGKGKTSQGLFTLFCPAGQTGPYGGSGYGFAGSFRYAPFAQEALK
jgi:hypothetical protein